MAVHVQMRRKGPDIEWLNTIEKDPVIELAEAALEESDGADKTLSNV